MRFIIILKVRIKMNSEEQQIYDKYMSIGIGKLDIQAHFKGLSLYKYLMSLINNDKLVSKILDDLMEKLLA